MRLESKLCLVAIVIASCASKSVSRPTVPTIPEQGSRPSEGAERSSAGVSYGRDTTNGQPADEEKLKRIRAKIAADRQSEMARFTPELRREAMELSDADYRTAEEALRAVLSSPHRQPGNAARDKYRHPRETLEYFGFQPSLTVLEYGPGTGWYTELLAPALARGGKLFVTSEGLNGPPDNPATLAGIRLQSLLEVAPEVFGKVGVIVVDSSAPKLALEGSLDLVLVIRELHNFVSKGTLDAWLAEFHRALKPHGILGIVDHRAKSGTDPAESVKQGYLPEAWAIEVIERAGFALTGKSEINGNPKDTKDYAAGVWTLPPTYRLGDVDREKYAAIGESDRFTLRFVKVK